MAEDFLTQMMALEALRPSVSDELLNDDGRYFRDSCSDLTQCTHGETGNYRNRADGKAIALLWNLWRGGNRHLDWRTMDSAPRDGTVIEACARLPTASAGFPQYIFFLDGNWRTTSYISADIVVPWAWRPRTEWPREPGDVVSSLALAAYAEPLDASELAELGFTPHYPAIDVSISECRAIDDPAGTSTTVTSGKEA